MEIPAVAVPRLGLPRLPPRWQPSLSFEVARNSYPPDGAIAEGADS